MSIVYLHQFSIYKNAGWNRGVQLGWYDLSHLGVNDKIISGIFYDA